MPRLKPTVKRFAILIGLTFALYAVPAPWTSALRDASLRVVRPLGSFLIQKNSFVRGHWQALRQLPSLRAENAALQQRVLELQGHLAEKESLQRENESLKNEVGVSGVTRETKKVLARVVVMANDPFDRSFTVDVGSAQGIREGQPAVFQGALVGRVIAVRQNSAVIRSIASRESKIQVWVSQGRHKGLLVGDGASASLTRITQGTEVKPGSIVETSGLGNSLPQGILVGETTEATSEKSESTQSFRVKIPSDPTSLENVYVLLTDF